MRIDQCPLGRGDPGMVTYAFNPSALEADAGGLSILAQPGHFSKDLRQKFYMYGSISIKLTGNQFPVQEGGREGRGREGKREEKKTGKEKEENKTRRAEMVSCLCPVRTRPGGNCLESRKTALHQDLYHVML